MDRSIGKKIKLFILCNGILLLAFDNIALPAVTADSPQARSEEVKKILEMEETKIEGNVEKPEIISIVKRKRYDFQGEKKEFKFEPKNILKKFEVFKFGEEYLD